MRGIDTPVKISAQQALGLVKAGVTHIGRYLGSNTSWKSISKTEADILKSAGLQIFSILEKAPTKVSYFTATQGKQDAIDAYNYAKAIGQPTGTAIYFTVDYDAQSSDFNQILTYFHSIKANLKDYVIGVYGSYSIINFLHSKNAANYYMQTLAWSGGKKCSFINIYQSTNDKKLNGIDIDDDILLTTDIGAWGQSKPVLEVNQTQQPTYYTLRNGDTGNEVADLQNKLIKLGYQLKSDGVFGNGTESALKQMQKDYGLVADGICGKDTWNTIFNQLKGQWKKENSIWYYYENGKKRIGWLQDSSKWYYLKEDSGQMVANGWYKVANFWYHFAQDGSMQTGWITDKGKKYYLNPKDGKMQIGTQTIDGKTYTFNSDGSLK